MSLGRVLALPANFINRWPNVWAAGSAVTGSTRTFVPSSSLAVRRKNHDPVCDCADVAHASGSRPVSQCRRQSQLATRFSGSRHPAQTVEGRAVRGLHARRQQITHHDRCVRDRTPLNRRRPAVRLLQSEAGRERGQPRRYGGTIQGMARTLRSHAKLTLLRSPVSPARASRARMCRHSA